MAHPAPEPIALTAPRPGDLGWIVHAHGVVYAESMGWGAEFEGLVAEIVAGFAARDHERERCWIARRDDQPVGCVMLTRDHGGPDPEHTARLRVLLVTTAARGTGLGLRLCRAVIEAARAFGDQRIVLTTTERQTAARAIYRRCGFELERTEGATSFAPELTDEHWGLELR